MMFSSLTDKPGEILLVPKKQLQSVILSIFSISVPGLHYLCMFNFELKCTIMIMLNNSYVNQTNIKLIYSYGILSYSDLKKINY